MKKYKIGYTTGVFDMFHIGHLNILREAKKQCEYLIVGVSIDEVVEQYKNKRPIIPYEDRAEIVQSVRYVDKVVGQYSMDKMDAWRELKFDVMFHGDDWKDSPLYKEYQEKFSAVNVDLVFIPYTKGISSTQIYEEIQSK
jgi:glycerol-3-phosphate cytidylyltransferase